jgi:hypothetical protein
MPCMRRNCLAGSVPAACNAQKRNVDCCPNVVYGLFRPLCGVALPAAAGASRAGVHRQGLQLWLSLSFAYGVHTAQLSGLAVSFFLRI